MALVCMLFVVLRRKKHHPSLVVLGHLLLSCAFSRSLWFICDKFSVVIDMSTSSDFGPNLGFQKENCFPLYDGSCHLLNYLGGEK